MVFHEEIDQLQYPKVKLVEGKERLGIDSCFHSLQLQYPNAFVSSLSLPDENNELFVFSMYDSTLDESKKTIQVFIHPQTAAILGNRGGSDDWKGNRMGWISSFHNSFQLKKKGEWLLGFLSIIFLISLLTGIIHYRKKILPVLTFNKFIYRKTNLHQIIGIYALLFNLMIAGSGFWMQRYVFKSSFYQDYGSFNRTIKPTPPPYFSIDKSLKEAKKSYTEFTPYVIYFAQKKERNTAVYGSNSYNSFIHSKKLADVIFLDSTGKVTKTAFVNMIEKDSKRDIINAQIHYGKYGGLPIKILYCLFGLSGGILSITGFIIWRRRNKSPMIKAFNQ